MNLKIVGILVLIAIVLVIGYEPLQPKNISSTGGMGFNLSYAPIEQFCKDTNQTYIVDGNIFNQRFGCVDTYGEIHFYKVVYVDEYWLIGNGSMQRFYKAEWTSEDK